MLNRAHALHRQAEKATRKGDFDEAVKLHKEAADLLNQLLENILEEKFAESIRLQAQLHEKEKTILRNQKKKAEKAYRESVIRNMSNKEAGQTSNLLDKLQLCEEHMGEEGTRAFTAVPSDYLLQNSNSNQDVVVGVASKKPKDDKVIIEELQVANCHLRKMVDSLFHELSTCQRENLELKSRIRYLESMQGPGSGIISPPTHRTLMQSQSAQPSPHLGLRTFKSEQQSPSTKCEVVVSSVIGINPLPTSPAMSPAVTAQVMGEDSPSNDADSSSGECHLPPLPPLDMPTFDFDKRNEA